MRDEGIALAIVAVFSLVYTIPMFARFVSRRMVFSPTRQILSDPGQVGLSYEEVWLGHGSDRLHSWWVDCDKGHKVVILLHGTKGNISFELPALRVIHNLGASVLAIDYPGYGLSAGSVSEKGCLDTAERAWNYLREVKGYRAKDIILFGRSLGSGPAVALAAAKNCGGLVLSSAFTSIPELAVHIYRFKALRYLCRVFFNNRERIGDCSAPILILHSTNDVHNPFQHALELRSMTNGPCRLVALSGRHDDLGWARNLEACQAFADILNDRASRCWHKTSPVESRLTT